MQVIEHEFLGCRLHMSQQSLVDKYAPATVDEVIQYKDTKTYFLNWLTDFPNVKLKGCFMEGKPGVGKTSLIHAAAHDLGYEIVELNASDERSRKKMDAIVHASIGSAENLFGGKTLLVIEEIDTIDGRVDADAIGFLTRALAITQIPIVFTANDWKRSLETLKKKCLHLKFKRLRKDWIIDTLTNINVAENLGISPTTIEDIAYRSDGDLRSAINDLELGEPVERTESLPMYEVWKMLIAPNPQEARKIMEQVDLDTSETFQRLYSVLIKVYLDKKIDSKTFIDNMLKAEQIDRLLNLTWRKVGYSNTNWTIKDMVCRLHIDETKLGFYIDSTPSVWSGLKMRKSARNSFVKSHTSRKKMALYANS